MNAVHLSYAVRFAIEVPARAEFAVKVFHDEDMDAMVTRNWTGYIPKEGLGFSAGVTIPGGAPTFQQAKITFTVNETIKVSIADPAVAGDLVKNRTVK